MWKLCVLPIILFVIYSLEVKTEENVPCGTTVRINTSSTTPLILYGQEVSEGQHPWHVALFSYKDSREEYSCGGSLVNKQYVITAAHCTTYAQTEFKIPTEEIVAYFGKFLLSDNSNAGLQRRTVSHIIVHQGYKSEFKHNDIAMLRLKEPVAYTEYVRPICLWEGDTNINLIIDQIGTVVGWGKTEESTQPSEKLKRASMPVASKEACIASNHQFYLNYYSNTALCAGFKNGTAPCSGDSGGGMVFPRKGSDENNPVWQLRALVSIAIAKGARRECDASQYVVLTDVTKFLPWIYSTMIIYG